jgi:hypothetical protein
MIILQTHNKEEALEVRTSRFRVVQLADTGMNRLLLEQKPEHFWFCLS